MQKHTLSNSPNRAKFPQIPSTLASLIDIFWVHCFSLDQKIKRHNTRYQLSKLDTHLLRDIGIDEAQRDKELNKKFWQD